MIKVNGAECKVHSGLERMVFCDGGRVNIFNTYGFYITGKWTYLEAGIVTQQIKGNFLALYKASDQCLVPMLQTTCMTTKAPSFVMLHWFWSMLMLIGIKVLKIIARRYILKNKIKRCGPKNCHLQLFSV